MGSVVFGFEEEGVVEDGVLAEVDTGGGAVAVLGREGEGGGDAGGVPDPPTDLELPNEALDWTGAVFTERVEDGAGNWFVDGCAEAGCRKLVCGITTLCCPADWTCRVDTPEPTGAVVTVEPKGEVMTVPLPLSCRIVGCNALPCCETKPWGEATPTGKLLRVDLTDWAG